VRERPESAEPVEPVLFARAGRERDLGHLADELHGVHIEIVALPVLRLPRPDLDQLARRHPPALRRLPPGLARLRVVPVCVDAGEDADVLDGEPRFELAARLEHSAWTRSLDLPPDA
jgi:hypothetical protein